MTCRRKVNSFDCDWSWYRCTVISNKSTRHEGIGSAMCACACLFAGHAPSTGPVACNASNRICLPSAVVPTHDTIRCLRSYLGGASYSNQMMASMRAGESGSSMRRRAWVVDVEKTLDEADASVEVSRWQLHSIYHVSASTTPQPPDAGPPQFTPPPAASTPSGAPPPGLDPCTPRPLRTR